MLLRKITSEELIFTTYKDSHTSVKEHHSMKKWTKDHQFIKGEI